MGTVTLKELMALESSGQIGLCSTSEARGRLELVLRAARNEGLDVALWEGNQWVADGAFSANELKKEGVEAPEPFEWSDIDWCAREGLLEGLVWLQQGIRSYSVQCPDGAYSPFYLPEGRVALAAMVDQLDSISAQQAAWRIASEDALFNAVAIYTADNPDILDEEAEVSLDLRKLLAKVKPFIPNPWSADPLHRCLYRGEPEFGVERDRGISSFSANLKTAEEFARDYRQAGRVLRTEGGVKAVSLLDIATYRMRMTDESHYAGMQAEYFVLDAGRKVDSRGVLRFDYSDEVLSRVRGLSCAPRP